MKALLLYRDRDFDWGKKLPPNEPDLSQDLELDTLFNAMAAGDQFLFDVAKKVVLSGETDPAAILYRQDILRDCRANAAIVRGMYALAVEAIERERKNYWHWADYPQGILHRSVEVLEMFVEMLKRLRAVADEHADNVKSEGFRTIFAMLKAELSEEYFAEVNAHLHRLRFRDGVLLSAEPGKGNKGRNYVLRRPNKPTGLIERIFGDGTPVYTLHVDPRDENGARMVSELADTGINLVANAMAQSTEHILSFFRMLRTELAFYVGCLNLEERLAKKGEPLCFPAPAAEGERRCLSFKGLYDICLSLTIDRRVVGNDVNANGRQLVFVTGANQGGKSTFLRSVGLAQLMMQAGMCVAADAFAADVCEGLFTHYKREEDTTMKSGKFDEELSRMSGIVDLIAPRCMVLFNESFAATNEREGSEIASRIVDALLENGVKVVFVTHMFELANRFHDKKMETAIFLRAEREAGGRRTFKIVEGEPLPTSFGEDLYDRIFGSAATESAERQPEHSAT